MRKGLSLVIVLLLAGILSSVFLPGCAEKQETIKIVTSFPMRGITLGQGIVNGIELALEENNYKVGDYNIELVVKDGGDETGQWQEYIEADIANEASKDPDVMVYIGTFNSGAAKVSIPINNKAGLAQISPANTWPGLTQFGFIPGEPGIFYPTGIRNYFRVVPTDVLQGPAGAIWAQELGVKNVYIFDDGEVYGKGIADLFEKKALEIGLNVVDQKTIDKHATDFTDNINELKNKNIDLIYFGGVTPNGLLFLIQDIRNILGQDVKFMGPDGIMEQAFIDQSNNAAEGAYLTHAGISPRDLETEKGKKFYADYKLKYNEEPEDWAAFGYEAAKVALLAIERAEVKDRARILEAMSQIKNYDGLFGTWSFDEKGDTSLETMGAYIIENGKFVFQKLLTK